MELIFVHGALVRDGAWWWQRTADLLLERAGVHSRALALPSCGETTPEQMQGGLVADADSLRRELDGLEEDSVIVVGHSYGGTVIAEAGRHPAIAHLVYISSYLPDIGQAQADIMSGESDPVTIHDAGNGNLGIVGYNETSFGARFLHDAEAPLREQAWRRVTAQAASAFMTPTTADAWRGVDSTYLVCVDDRSTSIDLQRSHAERASRSVDLPTGHHPFISRPDLVVDQLQRLIDAG